ncbi:MAG: hypothetical protein PF637_13685 [Spirochaetes bacterium]|nr:hypothetical protein [Spirochaetota bacterium]
MKDYNEKQILSAKDPAQFIDRCVNSRVSRGKKIVLGRQWREKTGYSMEDIEYARNRHPYWKQKKMAGWRERNEKRWSTYNYTSTESLEPDYWTKNNFANLREYIKKDKKGTNGLYKIKDRELAEFFKTSIPSIQHMRRKSNMVTRILEKRKMKDNLKNRLDLMQLGETTLRDMISKK